MAEWKSSYGGRFLSNARLLTKEEIDKRYPIKDKSRMAKLTHEFVRRGFDILYGENHDISSNNIFQCYEYWLDDVLLTAADLYKKPPDCIEIGAFTDMSQSNAIYVAVKLNYKIGQRV